MLNFTCVRQGLASQVYSNQPCLSLVSNGADCLLMSKQFFFRHGSDKVINALHQQVLRHSNY